MGLVALAVSACGSGLRPHRGLPVTEQLLTPADISRTPAGSPQRALITWWRDVQFSNQIGYLDFLAPPIAARELRSNVAGLYLAILSGQLQPAKPQIVGMTAHANLVTIYSSVISHQPIGTQLYVTTSRPQAFTLARVDGRWRLLDDYFVRVLVGPVLAARGQPVP